MCVFYVSPLLRLIRRPLLCRDVAPSPRRVMRLSFAGRLDSPVPSLARGLRADHLFYAVAVGHLQWSRALFVPVDTIECSDVAVIVNPPVFIGVLGVSQGVPWVSQGVPWVSLGVLGVCPLGVPWVSLGVPWVSLGVPWVSLGVFRCPLGVSRDHTGPYGVYRRYTGYTGDIREIGV